MIVLRDYQDSLYKKIHLALVEHNKVLAQLETGGGKSVIIGKLATSLYGRTLILTHRAEILEQNAEWVDGIGCLTAKENTVGVKNKVVIAMIQTLHARIKKYGELYIGAFDNIILDEVHVQIFAKVFSRIPHKYLIGFTATPVINKKRTFKVDDVEFVEDITLSETFDTIVTGPTTNELIELGHLIQDHNIVLDIPDFDKLKESASTPDGYTTKSLNDVYNNRASLEVLHKAIESYCKGKKTLIFNSTTDSNVFVLDALLGLGYNARLYDSVNSKASDRKEIVEWFDNEKEAILIGTNVFTTGFNVTDIEVVIVNRATKSLGLWIQMVGRGSRPTDKIFKDRFTVIDLGQNVSTHDIWSANRDWESFFYPSPPRRKRKTDLIQVWECKSCGAFNLKGTTICEICGEPKGESKKVTKKDKDGELIEIAPVPLPKSKSIIDYVNKINESSDFAFKLLESRIIELFTSRSVDKDFYISKRSEFLKRVEEIYRPIYFAIIRSDLKGSRKRLSTQFNRMKLKIDKMYKINTNQYD